MKDLNFDIVKIIDDDYDSALQSQYILEDLGIETELITEGHYQSTKQLLDKVLNPKAKTGVICDHRLMHGAFANFYGSEFVAELYKRDIPAILLTQFSDSDINISIRKFRRWTPVMIPRDQLTTQTLPMGFDFCERELSGAIPDSRVPHRTLVEILGYSMEQDEEIAEAYVPGWSTDHVIRFPLALMGEELQSKTINTIRADDPIYVFAKVNVGAIQSSDLFFADFEWIDDTNGSALDNLLR